MNFQAPTDATLQQRADIDCINEEIERKKYPWSGDGGNTWDDIKKWADLVGKDPSEIILKLDHDTPLGPHCLLIDRSVHGWGLEGNMSWNEDPEYVELVHDGVVAETDRAVLLDFGGIEIWIPRSQIEDDDLEEAGTVSVTEWFAEQEELEQYAA
jgi:hypothetical protein